METLALWLVYAGSVAAAVGIARRWIGPVSARVALLLALLPLVFTGEAMRRGMVYGPSDLYFAAEPWSRTALAGEVGTPRNPILSDLAFANMPWRAAVRESLANGRLPLWNRFALGGGPLLGTAQAGVLHPSTWLGIALPLPLSWTFSCTFTLFLALLAAYLFFRDFGLGARAALVGAVGWGFSTYVVFWVGWSVGPSTATFPLLLLGLRRLARQPGRTALALTSAALCLSLFGGHPESFFHAAAAGAVYFLWELAGADRRGWPRSVGLALGAGGLALLLSAPQLLPLLAAIPRSAEYRARSTARAAGASAQSVPAAEAAARLLPDLLPFAHGIYGKSPVDGGRADGSGMPLGYAGAVLFAPALLALARRSAVRGRTIFLALFVAGLAYGASFPGIMDVTARLPGFALALNYRLVFLAGLGLAGLAALGTQSLSEESGARRLAVACVAVAIVAAAACIAARPVFVSRGLPRSFVRLSLVYEVGPVLLLAAAAGLARRRPRIAADAVVLSLVLQRFLEMGGTYPSLPAQSLGAPLPTLAALPLGSDPSRIVAAGGVFRPNGATLYGLEDARGYESLVLDRLADTYPLWSEPQAASFNRVPDVARPFLAFLNVRYAIAGPTEAAPPGWLDQARGPEMAVFANPGALARAFVPRTLRRVADPAARLSAMSRTHDFGAVAFLGGEGAAEERNGAATLRVREVGPDLVIHASVSSRAFVATSLPDWPGWTIASGARRVPSETVNHAFVGFWLEPGEQEVRLAYRPASWHLGLAAFLAGLAISLGLALSARGPGAATGAPALS